VLPPLGPFSLSPAAVCQRGFKHHFPKDDDQQLASNTLQGQEPNEQHESRGGWIQLLTLQNATQSHDMEQNKAITFICLHRLLVLSSFNKRNAKNNSGLFLQKAK